MSNKTKFIIKIKIKCINYKTKNKNKTPSVASYYKWNKIQTSCHGLLRHYYLFLPPQSITAPLNQAEDCLLSFIGQAYYCFRITALSLPSAWDVIAWLTPLQVSTLVSSLKRILSWPSYLKHTPFCHHSIPLFSFS